MSFNHLFKSVLVKLTATTMSTNNSILGPFHKCSQSGGSQPKVLGRRQDFQIAFIYFVDREEKFIMSQFSNDEEFLSFYWNCNPFFSMNPKKQGKDRAPNFVVSLLLHSPLPPILSLSYTHMHTHTHTYTNTHIHTYTFTYVMIFFSRDKWQQSTN